MANRHNPLDEYREHPRVLEQIRFAQELAVMLTEDSGAVHLNAGWMSIEILDGLACLGLEIREGEDAQNWPSLAYFVTLLKSAEGRPNVGPMHDVVMDALARVKRKGGNHGE